MRCPKTALSETDRATLERMSRKGKAAQRDVLRARIVLLTAAGGSDLAVAAQLRINRHTVRVWRQRFAAKGLAGLTDTPGRGRKPVLTGRVTDSILTGAVQPRPIVHVMHAGVAARWPPPTASPRARSNDSGRRMTSSRT